MVLKNQGEERDGIESSGIVHGEVVKRETDPRTEDAVEVKAADAVEALGEIESGPSNAS